LDHIRIDEGLARPKREYPPRTELGTFADPYSPDQKQAAIEDAIVALEQGETTDSIATRHKVRPRTLRAWLIADDRAVRARAILLSSKLMDAVDAISASDSAMPLARAREEFRSWAWIAERRLPEMFGQHDFVDLKVDIGTAIQRISERMRAVAEQQISEKIIESSSEQAEPLHINELDDNLS
jgi:hypothetical protein